MDLRKYLENTLHETSINLRLDAEAVDESYDVLKKQD